MCGVKSAAQSKNTDQFAEKIGVSASAVSAWMRGIKQPTADNIILIARFFGVTTDYILGVSDS